MLNAKADSPKLRACNAFKKRGPLSSDLIPLLDGLPYAAGVFPLRDPCASGETASQPQRFFHIIPHDTLVLLAVFSPHLRCLDICRTLVIRFREHAHDADEDLLDALDRGPPLRGGFVLIRVIAGGMQNRYADATVLVDCSAC